MCATAVARLNALCRRLRVRHTVQALGGFDDTGLLDVVQSESVCKVVYDLRNDLDALFQYPVRSFIDTSVVGLVAREECYHTRCDHFFSIDQMFNAICGSTAFTFHVARHHFHLRRYDAHPINTADIELGRKEVLAWKDKMRPYMQADTERKIWTSRPLSNRNIAYAGLNALLSYAMWESTATKWGLSIGQGGDLHGSNKGVVTKIVAGTKWMGDCYREKLAGRARSADVPRGLWRAMWMGTRVKGKLTQRDMQCVLHWLRSQLALSWEGADLA